KTISGGIVKEKLIKNIDEIEPLGKVKYISLDRENFERFYSTFIGNTKGKPLKTYKEFFNFLFSESGLDNRLAELIWTNSNPNIDILKFNDLWNYLYVKEKTSGRLLRRTMDKLDLVLPTYEFSFNTSGLFSIEVEARYQYKNILLTRHRKTALVDLLDYIIDTTQEDFLAGVIESAKSPTKNGLALITYPELKVEAGKNNNIDGQLGLSPNVDIASTPLCSLAYDENITMNVRSGEKLKINEKFLTSPQKYSSVFNLHNSPAITPNGILIDGIKSLTIPINFCFDSFKTKSPAQMRDLNYFEEYYDALYFGLSAWVMPSYYSLFYFPFSSFYSEEDKLAFSIFKVKEEDLFQVIAKGFEKPFRSLLTKKFFGCSENFEVDTILFANRWFHLGISIELKSCIEYAQDNEKLPDTTKIKLSFVQCPYYTLYINGLEIEGKNYISKVSDSISYAGLKDYSDFRKLIIGDGGIVNTFFTVDNIKFHDKYGLLKNILEATNKGRYYNQDTKFTSRQFSNPYEYLYLLSSEVFLLPIAEKYNNFLCIKLRDITGATDCYGDLINSPYARWNVSFVGQTFNYEINWKNTSFCGNNISPVIDSVILTILKKPSILTAPGD
ncbi:MAG: hypothetical protein ACK4NF_06870, partial [Planctomycetota bacterium]